MFASVLVQYGVKVLDKTFIYKIPDGMIVSIGNKVRIPFANKIIKDIVINITNDN